MLEFKMSRLPVLAFTVAHTMDRGHALVFFDPPPASEQLTKRFERIHVLVASRDVWLARKALLACPEAIIVRCLPMPNDARVKLDIRFPAGQGGAVINRILSCLPCGELGGTWTSATPSANV
jgi:hypothetical protein